MLDDVIREVLRAEARLDVDPSEVAADGDLFLHGLTSHATVNVMLGLEDRLEVEFPDDLLRKDTFRSVTAIRDALVSLGCPDR